MCYAGDIVPPAHALQTLIDTLMAKLYDSSLEINVKKSCCILFSHNRTKVSTRLPSDNLLLRQVTGGTYLGVVLSDDVSCTKDLERAKLAFFSSSFQYVRSQALPIRMY